MVDTGDKAREEFYSEAQEIVETLSRNLLALDEAQRSGASDPSLVNEAFRAVHTLKGLAGLFGATKMGALSHRLEDVLDDLRLGRIELSADVLDVLFRAVEVYGQILSVEKKLSDDPLTSVDEVVQKLDRIGSRGRTPASPAAEYELDPGMLAVLTEYEEHRLRTNIEQGMRLYRMRIGFDLATIDKALEDIKKRARKLGEIITYLPTGETASPDSIELDLLMASREDLATLIGVLGADNVVIDEIPRRARAGARLSSMHDEVRSLPKERAVEAMQEAPMVDKPAPPEPAGSLRAVTQTVRVDIRKLDHLMNIVGELGIVRSALGRVTDRLRAEGQRQLAAELHRLQRSFERRLGEMQNGILEVRMVPLGQVFDRLARVVRQISRELSKEIRLVITGAETEIDKLIVEELSDPLMHMIRNAIDHGIEAISVRREVGKPDAGTIALNAYQKGNHVMIEIEDDGAGIDEETVIGRAVELGQIERAEVGQLTREEVLALIFFPGISTRQSAGDLSGRGVGMDVVKTNISKLGGVIDVHSERGIGTKFTITLPITLAIVSALIVRVAGQTFAIPLSSVTEAIQLDEPGVRVVDGREVMTLRGASLPLCRLESLFHVPDAPESGSRRRFVVVCALALRRLGLVVEQLIGQQDIVIKALGPSLSGVRGFAGATELGDQRVGLVLDAPALIEEVLASAEPMRQARLGLHG